jgi:hypothetical protein
MPHAARVAAIATRETAIAAGLLAHGQMSTPLTLVALMVARSGPMMGRRARPSGFLPAPDGYLQPGATDDDEGIRALVPASMP